MSALGFRGLMVGGLVSLACFAASAKAEAPKPFTVDGHFDHAKSKKGKDKFAISGIDCLLPAQDGTRLCLLVDDEMTAVQFGMLTSDSLKVGAAKDLGLDSGEIIGKRPHKVTNTDALNCSGGKSDGELDGEAVAHIGTTFYIVGSHGCSRSHAEYKPQTFVLSRIVMNNGQAGDPQNTYQLSRAILQSDVLKPHFGRDLDGPDGGISIEGMTAGADGKSLIIAFRSPSLQNNAFLMTVKIDPLFEEGDGPAAGDIKVTPVPLGANTGFRDIERLDDGRFLALTGAATEDKAPYTLRMLNPDFSLQQESVDVPPLNGGSPEAIEWLGDGRVLILSDDVEDGGPFTVHFP